MPDSEQKTPEAVLVQPSPTEPVRHTGGELADPKTDFEAELAEPLNSVPPHASADASGWQPGTAPLHSFEELPALPESAFHEPGFQESNRRESALEVPSDPVSDDPADLPLSHEVNQSLARLEMNSLQVKLYLDSIEEKISRMEPRLEQIRDGQQPSSDTTTSTTEREGSSDPALAIPVPSPPRPAESTTERRRRRFDIPSPADEGNDPLSSAGRLSDDDPWAFKPWLFARRKQLAIAGSVFLAFVAILTFGTSNHPAPPAATAVPANTPAPAPPGSIEIPKSSAGIPMAATGASTSFPGAQPQPVLNSPSTLSQSTDTASDAPIAPTGTFPTSAADALPGTLLSSPSAATPFRDPASTDVPSGTHIIPASGRVRVSSGVMAGNLLYSPTPKYPGGFASLFHMEGKVTMQAIIARSGRVENVRVISGHRLLRGAAQDAVRTWRYRPFAVNGIPVEVATIVTVEFHR